MLIAFGILSAIGSNIVDRIFPDVWDLFSSDDSVRVYVRDGIGANDGFELATAASAGFDSELKGVDGCESLLAVAEEVGASRVGRSVYDLVVEGSTRHDATIVDVRPEIVERGAALNGAEFVCDSAGGINAIGIAFDFDEPQPVARYDAAEPKAHRPYFGSGNVIVLKDGEVQPIQITGEITRGSVAWNLKVDLVVDGKSKTMTVDDNGHPFRLTAAPPTAKYQRHYEWRWYEDPQSLYIGNHPYSH